MAKGTKKKGSKKSSDKKKTRRCKGRIINGYLKFVKKKWGKDGVDQCVKVVGKELKNVQDDRWYPVTLTDDVIHWIADTHGMDAVRMWYRWERKGDRGQLDRLVRYCGADIGHLETLARHVDDELTEKEYHTVVGRS